MEYKARNRHSLRYGKLTDRSCVRYRGINEDNGIIYPRYLEGDVYMSRYNQLAIYNQNMNIQAKVYENLLDSGMGPYQ